MANSALVNYTMLSPNNSGKRTKSIDRITPHCIVGQLSVESLGSWFYKESTQASSNYGIGFDGRVGLYVPEDTRSWCSSSNANDQRAVTIECASERRSPYEMNDKVYNKLVMLCADICRRNGKSKLLYFADKDYTLAYEPKEDEMILTVHRWFSSTDCPGDWLMERLPTLATQVTTQIPLTTGTALDVEPLSSNVLYHVQVGAYKQKDNAISMYNRLRAAGYDAFITCDNGRPVV